MGKPGKENWHPVKQIFRCLKGTIDIGLIYQGDTSCALVGYSNSNYATYLDVRRFVTGYAFTIGNPLVSWKATHHPMVALSTTEVEYMILPKVAKKGI